MKNNNEKISIFTKYNKLFFMLLSIVIGLLVGALALILAGYNPLEAYKLMLEGVFKRPKNVGWTIVNAIPIIFTGLGVAFAFKTGLFNIGAEGQYIVGTMVAFILGYNLHLPAFIHVPVVIIVGMLAGAAFGALAGFLKAKFGIHEVISTIMLNWIAFYFNNMVANYPKFKAPNSMGTHEVQETAKITLLQNAKGLKKAVDNFFKAPIHMGLILAIVAAILLWYILKKTNLGYELKAVGLNQDAAKYGGINVNKKLTLSMAISGAVCALGGITQVLGYRYTISALSSMENFGFDGLAVSLLANNNPIGCIFSGLFFGGLKYSGANVQRVLHAPTEMINIIMGTIILFTAIPLMFRIIKSRFKNKGGK
ncbi:ABC transporter permease [Finegoldia magna]|uniref:ABC transporter permease n=1 Tax=Finegoldia magna TaxID=1260 RepID=A0A233VYT4_FINMA|nr:ABC transporter permease [Finegoldia magna]OXZ37556.1 ABC transporter permease [Finegoldia magna]